jgi:branched-chain amino acid transport system ATP-binding protein
MNLLTVNHLTMRFGGLTAVDGVSFDAAAGQITAIIGPNGAGKTTLFNCLTGFYRPTGGQIVLDGLQLAGLSSAAIFNRARVARTFQNLRLFGGMTVLENLLVAQHGALMRASGFSLAGIFNTAKWRLAERSAIEKARYWLEKTSLLAFADLPAESLAYGNRRRLEIARALVSDPVLLCLDEPAAGLNPAESAALNELLRDISAQHRTTILLIEHDMSVVMSLSDHIVVLDHGAKIAEGTPAEVRANPAVVEAYLGVSDQISEVR